MPDAPPLGATASSSNREWEDPRIVPAGEVAKWMDQGWEPCGHVVMPARNNETGQPMMVLYASIRRRFSPVRTAIESTSRVARARTVIEPFPMKAR